MSSLIWSLLQNVNTTTKTKEDIIYRIINSPILRNLRAISVTDGSVLLTWSPGDDLEGDNVVLRNDPDVQYEIYYKAITENSSNAAVFESDKVRNSL